MNEKKKILLREKINNKSITIAMPAYNEEGNIELVVNEAFKVLKSLTKNYEVLVVNDCSTDKTKEILEKLQKKFKKLKVINHKKNLGIGIANYHIYKNVKSEILFWNASDNQIHMDEIYTLLPHIFTNDIVIGNRFQRADSFKRKLFSGIFNLSFRLRFGIKIKDVDSVKIFRTKIFNKINIISRSAFIETEILIKAKKLKLKLKEVNIKHYPRLKGKAQGIKLKIIIPQLFEYSKFFFGINK